MAEMKAACLVKSLAGHDKDEFYIIIRVQGEYAYLSDGRKHSLRQAKAQEHQTSAAP